MGKARRGRPTHHHMQQACTVICTPGLPFLPGRKNFIGPDSLCSIDWRFEMIVPINGPHRGGLEAVRRLALLAPPRFISFLHRQTDRPKLPPVTALGV